MPENLISIILQFFVGFNMVLYGSRFRQNNEAYKLFTLYLLVIGINQFFSIILGQVFHQTNLMLFHVYFIAQFIILTFFYVALLKQRLPYIILILVGIGLIIQYTLHPSILLRYNPLGVTITQGILVMYTLGYFYKYLKGRDEFILVNTALFFYLMSSILIFASGNLVYDPDFVTQKAYRLMIQINQILYFAFQILILIQWWKTYSPARARS